MVEALVALPSPFEGLYKRAHGALFYGGGLGLGSARIKCVEHRDERRFAGAFCAVAGAAVAAPLALGVLTAARRPLSPAAARAAARGRRSRRARGRRRP